MNKSFATVLFLAAASLLLVGCPTKPVTDPEPVPETTDTRGAATAALPERRLPAGFDEPSSPLYQRIIYFDYDTTDILPQFVEVLRAHARYLSTHPDAQVLLQGHTDERGSREYNLALGAERNGTVKRYLLAEGVAGGQINSLSYGEERPADPAHGEGAWALNRRVQLVY